jgi:hypothetical protein
MARKRHFQEADEETEDGSNGLTRFIIIATGVENHHPSI